MDELEDVDVTATTDDHAGAATSSVDTAPAPPAPRPRGGARPGAGRPKTTHKRGTCKTCGGPAYSALADYCDEHKPLRADRAPRARTGATKGSRLELELRSTFELWAQLLSFRDPTCAQALGQQAGPMASYWVSQSRRSKWVAAWVEAVADPSGIMGAILVHAPLVNVVVQHHVVPVLERRRQAEAAELAGEPPNPNGGAAPWDLSRYPEPGVTFPGPVMPEGTTGGGIPPA